MTDGIPKISAPIITTLNDVNNEVETKAQETANEIQQNSEQLQALRDTIAAVKNSSASEVSELLQQNPELKELNSTNKPSVGYAQVRDAFETGRAAINQNTNTPPPNIEPPKIDTSNANLLNQQLLSARLGSALVTKETQTQSKDLQSKTPQTEIPLGSRTSSETLRNRAQLLPGIQSALDNVLQDAPSHLKEASSQLIGFLSEIKATEGKIASEKDAASVNFVTSVASAAGAFTSAAASSGSALNDFVNKALKAGTQSSASDLSERMQKIRDLIDSNNTNSSEAEAALEEQKSMSTLMKGYNIYLAIALTSAAVIQAVVNYEGTEILDVPVPDFPQVHHNTPHLQRAIFGPSIKDAAVQILPVLDTPQIVASVDAQRLGELRRKLEELLNS